MTKTALGVFFGIIAALVFLHIYRKYSIAKDKGLPFDFWGSLFGNSTTVSPTPVAGYVYENKKCYLSDGANKTEVDLQKCAGIPQVSIDLQFEYNNLANQISSLQNPNDPNNAANLLIWQNRQNEIIVILKNLKGCNPRQGFDISTLTCI